MEKYICIHGHFYQPPRENPWLEEIEIQDTARPYHDWNDRITVECYGPNTASRLLDEHERIIDIVNNYEKINFNFGPTLLSWLHDHRPDVYSSIIKADKKSFENFSGHGNAIAQCYNHIIMPLANDRDKHTQIEWGIKDFQLHFKRKPEGMWLPETAVDTKSLEMLAEFGIKYTILSPVQCEKTRKIGEKEWLDASDEKVDTTMPYVCNLPSGKSITLFFYHGPTSQEIAFKGLLRNGKNLAETLASILDNNNNDKNNIPARLAHVATDGETYGHHHRHGDMALAYAIHHIEKHNLARMTNYGQYLEKFPPTQEAKIFENSSWSCSHGVERWKSDCGCCSGANPNWHQKWRKPLRESLDWLSEKLTDASEKKLAKYTEDTFKARKNYIDVINDRSEENVNLFIKNNLEKATPVDPEQKIEILKALEIQRHQMLMYTSCGWFFDDIAGLETVQIIEYAARAIQLYNELTGNDLQNDFAKKLAAATGNTAKYKNGQIVYELLVKPSQLDYLRVGAHYAISSLFLNGHNHEPFPIYCYTVNLLDSKRAQIGRHEIFLGKLQISSEITRSTDSVTFAAIHLGDHNLIAGINRYRKDRNNYKQSAKQILEAFKKSDIAQAIHLIEQQFAGNIYSLWHLFKDEQRRVINQLLQETTDNVETSIRQIFENYYHIMQGIRQMNTTLPGVLAGTLEIMFNTDLIRAVRQENINLKNCAELLAQASDFSIELNKNKLSFTISKRTDKLLDKLHTKPNDITTLKNAAKLLAIFDQHDLNYDFWKAQNLYFIIGQRDYPSFIQKAENGDKSAKRWVKLFDELGQHLNVKV
jgi:alpha-amylase/alpha-mannosidase (GH57 family)